ncbi:MAG: S-layer homology domain-containing protein, partial [Syntrophomonas sp.]
MKIAARALRHFALLTVMIAAVLFNVGIMAMAAGVSAEAETKSGLAVPFKDVTSSDPNAIFITYINQLGIVQGFPDGDYHPREGLTRAQAAVVICKAAGLQNSETGQTGFADVNTGHWAAASISSAAKAGYLQGFPDGNYRPEEKLTRAQGISLVMRLSTQKEKAALPGLNDMKTDHWAAADMGTALVLEMIGLSPDGKNIYPDAVMNRGSLARALGILLTKDPGLYIKNLTGTIQDIKGEIKITRAGTSSPLQNGDPVYKGDNITAGAGSTASIVYPDGSSILIKENSELWIKESLGRACIKKDGSSGIAVENVDIELKKGTLFGALATKQETTTQEKQQARVGETLLASLDGMEYIADSPSSKTPPWYQQADAKKVKVKIDMPYGVAAIRGTYILVSVNQDGSCNVSCLTGDAEVGGKNGSAVPLGGGKSSGINPEGSVEPPAPMTEKEKQEFSAVQQWVVNTALQIDRNKEATAPPAVEMLVEVPDQALTPAQQAEQVQNTIDVVLNALEASGIQLTEQVKNELEQKLKEMQQELSQQAQQTLQNSGSP